MRLLFLNPQGNFDQHDSFWTEHPDFGGQLVYVKEIAMSIVKLGHQVDIVTRRFTDSAFNCFDKSIDFYPGTEGLRIIRIPCGPDEFLHKESLWPHIKEWVDNILSFYTARNETFDFVTTHYGDGGIAGAMIQEITGIPFSFTAHSLGAQKMDKLGLNHENMIQLEKQYRFSKRLLAERTAMKEARIIFTSTAQERNEQYRHKAYKGAGDADNPDKYVIAPPGANERIFSHHQTNDIEDTVIELLDRTLKRDIDASRLHLPYIVSASRLDPKKNHKGLLQAYAKNTLLQNQTNLAISLRGVSNAFEDISMLKLSEQSIMRTLFDIIDTHNLKGKISFINIDSQKALAASYRYFARKRSIFALVALYEPFGLAPIEAMCAGLPVAVTQYGGPVEVLKDQNGTYGMLLDVTDPTSVAASIIELFDNYDYYKARGLHRVNSAYTWKNTAIKYVNAIEPCLNKQAKRTLDIHPYFKSPSSESTPTRVIKDYYL